MVEVEEIELDLGLSIGGSFGKPQKPMPVDNKNPIEPDPRTNGFHSDLPKREIQAMRRWEAKKKRQQKRGGSRDWGRESEPEYQRAPKRGKTGYPNGVAWTTPFHVQQPHQYATLQFVPLNNGFALPFWVPSGSEKNVGRTQICMGLPPFLANGGKLEQNGEIDSGNCGEGKGKSNGSSMCSSSVVSSYQSSSSQEEGGSTDSHSHSAHSLAEPTQLNTSKENHITSQPEQSASSIPMRSQLGNNVKENEPNYITEPDPTKPKEEAITNGKSVPILPFTKPLSIQNSSNQGPLKDTNVHMEKPPKPLTHTTSLSQMPYVSTTGNGPNGKTVNGFLYKYTKSEVCIICVCHGSTFSPTEFVQHAGGTDISHPLRHITVIPSAFG